MRKPYDTFFEGITLLDWFWGAISLLVLGAVIAVGVLLIKDNSKWHQSQLNNKGSWVMKQYPHYQQIEFLFSERTSSVGAKGITTYSSTGWDIWRVKLDGTSFLVRCAVAGAGEYICVSA